MRSTGSTPQLRSAQNADELAAWVRATLPAEITTLDDLSGGIELAMRPTARLAVAVLSRVAEELVPGHLPMTGPLDRIREIAVIAGAEAALLGWCAVYGPGVGMLASMAAVLREVDESATGIPGPPGLTELGAGERALDWRMAVLDAVRGRLEPLERIRVALELSETELGALFGVSRQAVSQWREKGIPASRADAVAHVLQTVDLLDRKLATGRLALIARRPAERLAGRSILQALTEDPSGTHATFAGAFDWSRSA